ncbi:hypothetical protein [Winogradskyella bathintestinalis]|uniref:Uncharacterized protein n=1 Tax=Winogradskyella bathintestinalis TaxID=3035208 RepID=A0ABT7ZXQ1_9FLAO|nr:hypothetical protein [Winogradskyella bathintestinalis]MDN3493754.1 hypothetical protein [Winogradskyella bathintestinalis]
MTKENLKYHQQDKKSYNKKIFIGSIVATLVAATPFVFYLYEYVPDSQEWETIFGTYRSSEYGSANVAMWVLAMKVIPLLLSLIWFFTCRHWWYHALLVPITMFSYQCVVALNFDARYLDVADIIWLLPIMALVFPSIYLIRAKMFNKINNADKTLEELEEEFKIKPKGLWGKITQYF